MSRRLPPAVRCFLPLLATIAIFATTQNAHAKSGTALGVDLDYSHGISEPQVGAGTGFNARLGYKIDLFVAQLTPEVGGGYHTFSGDAAAKFSRGFVGGRLQFGKILSPGMYAHLGYGHLSEAFGIRHSGATGDAGVTLDLTLLPLVDLGVHAGYSGLLKSGAYPAFDTYVLGVHASLIF